MAHPVYEKAVAEYPEIPHIQEQVAGDDVHAIAAMLTRRDEQTALLREIVEHGRNGLGQIRRVRWACHSAFNHDWISYMILDYKIINHRRM